MFGLAKDYLVGLFAVAMAVVAGTQLGDGSFSVLASNTFIYMVMIGSIWAVPVFLLSIGRAIGATDKGQHPISAYGFIAMILGAVVLMIIMKAPLPPLEDANAYIGMPAALSLLAIWYLVSMPRLGLLMAPVTFGRRSTGSHDPLPATAE